MIDRTLRQTVAVSAGIALAAALAWPAAGTLVLREEEPNDTPQTANRLTGPARVLGTLPPGDQDGFLWQVSDVDAARRWTLRLDGVAGALTVVEVMRLEYGDDGVTPSGRDSLFTIGSRDGAQPAVAEDLMFEPGEYLLGVARAGGNAPFRPPVTSVGFAEAGAAPEGADAAGTTVPQADSYRLSIVEGGALGMTRARADGSARDRAIDLQPGREHVGLFPAADAWFAFTVTEQHAGQGWTLSSQVPVGRRLRLTLHGVAGAQPIRAAGNRHGHARLPELVLAPGRYMVQVEGDADTLRRVALEPGGLQRDGSEAEPNDQWAIANRVDLSGPLTGAFQRRNDSDYFAFTVSESLAEQRLALEAAVDGAAAYTFCLLDHRGRNLQCRRGSGRTRLDGLALEAGEYGLSLSRGAEGAAYTVRLEADGAHRPGFEAEPNDHRERATGIPANGRVSARTDRDDVDFYRLLVDGEPELWRVQVQGEGIAEVAYHDGSGAEAQKLRLAAGQQRATLDNLYLLPGTHYLSVRGSGPGEYSLRVRPLGPPDPHAELEPNDDATRMLPLAFGQTRTGTLADAADRDNYRFRLANHDRIRLSVRPPADGGLRARLYWGEASLREARDRASGEAVTLEGVFPPGDYRLELITVQPSEAEYQLSLERLPRFGCPVDCEPNDNPAFAVPVPADGVLEGEVGEWRDEDWYALPVTDRAAEVTIAVDRRQTIDLVAHAGDRGGLTWNRALETFEGAIPAGEQRYLRIRGNGPYRFRVAAGDTAAAVAEAPPVAVEVGLDAGAVAAYQPYGQRVDGRITVRNPGGDPVEVAIAIATSDARWMVRPEAPRVRLAAGEARSVAVQVQAPDDAWADRPVRISVAARDGQGRGGEAFVEIAVDRDAPLVGPVRHWAVPEALRGGLNLAWRSLGGRWLGDEDARLGAGLGQIFDGMAVRGEGLALRTSRQRRDHHSTVALAGSQPLPVAGIALDPLGRAALPQQLRRFELALSDDGESFRPVLAGALEPRPVEQYFALPEPVAARFARLRFIDDFTGDPGGMRGLGEWKVIARPGEDPSGGAGFDLADPTLGGHVVWSSPPISTRWDEVILDPASPRQRVRVRSGSPLEWVVGFHHNRAARIRALEWLDPGDAAGDQRIGAVEVSVSTDSPLGPWTSVGTWELAGQAVERLVLDTSVWARFVRFATAPAAADTPLAAPAAVRIFEQPADDAYRSILGEWGPGDHRAAFEAAHDIAPAPPFRLEAHGSRAAAAPLTPAQTVSGRVALGRQAHWYRLAVPADRNTLGVHLTGEPTLRTVVSAETEDGEPVLLRERRRSAAEQWLEGFVTPGQAVYLKVEEPERNVVFAWDTSASVGAYLPVIYSALAAYARDLVPGRDAANLMPFGSRLLLRDWHGEPHRMQMVLNEYPRGESSSAAETTLVRASEALARRAGAKAIVLITDAATSRDTRLWDVFERVRPRVFSLGLDSRGAFARRPAREQDLLQDWAAVNGGHYAPLGNEGELEVAFDRAATLLREPAGYRLTVAAEFRESPGPGTLRVRRAEGGDGGRGEGAVHFILDASGSMLQRIGGVRRIEIARRVLLDVMQSRLAPGTPVALRVFGHREANACRSDLELPLGPLDAAAASAVVSRVEARNLARTPIADSLAQVASDLAGASGRRTVVLLTDGEETCDGDPEAAIRALLDRGIDLRLNIVGFALDDAELDSQFAAWAELGGGRYFTAADSEGLSAALEAALGQPFAVYDRGGNRVAEGAVDGEPVALPPGRYDVVVGAGGKRPVTVTGGEATTLEVD